MNLSRKSGVYFLKNGRGEILYIGKSSDLKERVRTHFNQPTYKDKIFIDRVKGVETIETDSEIGALILESQLIKKYRPKYNYIWKDDKNYFYVAITKSKFPYIFLTHQPKIENCKLKIDFIGPFVDGNALKKTLSILKKVFPHYTQKKHPKTKCPWCHLGLCPGPEPDAKKYKRDILNLKQILKGKKTSVIKNLKNEMEKSSKNQNYETAAEIRNKIFALEKVLHNARIIDTPKTVSQTSPWYHLRIEGYDISNIQGKFAVGSMVVFENGKSNKSEYRKFKIKMKNEPNDTAMIKEIISRRLNHPEWPKPDIMLIDGGKGQLNAALKAAGSRKIKIMALAKKNNELFIAGKEKPILLENMPKDFANLILQVRDEAHRFAISYHKFLRQSGLLK